MSVSRYIALAAVFFVFSTTDRIQAQSSYNESLSRTSLRELDSHCGGTGHYGGNGHVHVFRGYGNVGYDLADLVRARADANLTNAQAASQAQIVRLQRLENDVVALKTRLERKHINGTTRFGQLHARGASLAKASLSSASVSALSADEERLGPNSVDAQSGRLAWPLLLAMSHFENARLPIDQVFAARAEAGVIHPDDYLPLLELINHMMEELQINAVIFPKEDLVEAQDFLRRMKIEARLPVQISSQGVHLVSQGR